MDNFWKNYQYLCAKKGVSVYEAAKACGIKSSGTVSYWRNGSRPNAETLNNMLAYFGVDPFEFIHGDIEAHDRAKQFQSQVADDPLYSAILKLTPQQRILVMGFIAGLSANSDNSVRAI